MNEDTFDPAQCQDDDDPILRLDKAAKYLGISPVSLWRLHAQEKTLERPIRIGRGTKGYRRSTLDEFIRERAKS